MPLGQLWLHLFSHQLHKTGDFQIWKKEKETGHSRSLQQQVPQKRTNRRSVNRTRKEKIVSCLSLERGKSFFSLVLGKKKPNTPHTHTPFGGFGLVGVFSLSCRVTCAKRFLAFKYCKREIHPCKERVRPIVLLPHTSLSHIPVKKEDVPVT